MHPFAVAVILYVMDSRDAPELTSVCWITFPVPSEKPVIFPLDGTAVHEITAPVTSEDKPMFVICPEQRESTAAWIMTFGFG